MNNSPLYLLPLLVPLLAACGPGADKCTSRNFEGCTALCEKGDGAACNTLGDMYRSGLSTNQDKVQAAASYAKACELDSADGCFGSYAALANGDGVPRDVETAVQRAEKGCRLGDAKSCQVSKLANQLKALAKPID